MSIFNKNAISEAVNSKYPPIVLWGTSASPFVRKVMVVLAEKNLPYEQKEILPSSILKALGQSAPDKFEQISPLGKIPVLEVDDFAIADSAVIANYIDLKFPSSNSLYPSKAEDYAKALWFEHYSDNVLTETGYKKIFVESVIKPKVLNLETNEEIVEHAKKIELPPILDYLNKSVTSNWLAAETFSIADVAIATQLLALKIAGFDLEQERWSNLNDYLEKVIARPSFKKFV